MKRFLWIMIPLFIYGSYLRDGIVLYKQKDYKSAMEAFQNAIDEDDSINAYYFLGLFYLKGYGVDPDLEKASRYLKKAYDSGNARAACLLGEINYKKNRLKKAKKLIREGLAEGAPECKSLARELGIKD